MAEILNIVFNSIFSFIGACILIGLLVSGPLHLIFKCWNRWLRSRNIKHRGWPPRHCDADGDFKQCYCHSDNEEEEPEEESN